MEIHFGEILSYAVGLVVSLWNSSFLDVVRFLVAVYVLVLFLDILMHFFLRDVGRDIRTGMFGADMPVAHKKFVKKQWNKVREHLSGHTQADWKIALLEADRIMEYVLEISNFSGSDFRERVERASHERLGRKEDLLKAHFVRNAIIKDPAYTLDHDTAKNLIDIYESVLKSWEAL